MRNSFVSIISFIVLGLFLFAQPPTYAQSGSDKISISGLVEEPGGDPIIYATVALRTANSDSSLVTGASTSSDGTFTLQAEPGNYLLRISFLSYIPHEQEIELTAGQEDVELGVITLQSNTEQMSEVVVSGERSQMELRLDRRSFSVSDDLSVSGGSAIQVLDNVPSVTTDIDGNVSLRGSQNVRILINGKSSVLTSGGSAALESLSADMIERVEVITNPSAKYSAEGEVGIINIILKKEEDPGVNGSVTASAGYPTDLGLSGNLNYRINKVNLFMNYGIEYDRDPGEGFLSQTYAGPDTSYSYTQNRDRMSRDFENTVRLGADWNISPSTMLTVSGVYDYETEDSNTDLRYEDLNANNTIISEFVREEEEEEEENDAEGTLTFEKQFSSKDHTLTFEAEYEYSNEGANSNFSENIISGSEIPDFQRSEDEEMETEFEADLDYVWPLGDRMKIETGLRASIEDSENNYFVQERDDNGNWITLDSFDQNFRYRQDVYAAYGIWAQELDRFSYQIGVRSEYTSIETGFLEAEGGIEQQYLDVFPSVHFTYKLNDSNSLQLSMSRRLSRPRSWYLLPFSDFTDQRNQRVGNPELNPEYTNSYEAGYVYHWDAGSLLLTGYYRYRTGVIDRITIAQGEGVTVRKPVNLSTQKSYGLEFNAEYELAEWWRINANLNYFNSNTEGTYQDLVLESSTNALYGRIGIQGQFWDGMRYQANARYRGPRNTTQGSIEPITTVNFGVSKQFFDNQATVSLSARDIFDTRRYERTINDRFLNSYSEFQWSSRQIQVSFTWRFNQDERDQRRSGNRGGGDDFEGEGMDY